VHRDVAAHGLEQVAVLVVGIERLGRTGEQREADQLVDVRERHDQPVARRVLQERGQRHVLVGIGRLAQLAQVDHPLEATQERGQLVGGRQHREPARLGEVARRPRG
jgi:hypothetical protein